jgi:hypothetical protein
MQLRSGRTTLTTRTQTQVRTLRRDSRNYEEFNERRRYQQEQKQIEESIYDDVDEEQDRKTSPLKKKFKTIVKRIKHLLYLNKCQNQNNRSFTEKVNNIKEIYELFLCNIDDLIEIFNGEMKHDLRFPEVIYKRGNQLRIELAKSKRTRNEELLAWECNDLINHVTQLINRYILNK